MELRSAHCSHSLNMTHGTGDYSDAQLLRVHRQAIVLRRYYQLLADAISGFQNGGRHYLVVQLASEAGRSLGDDYVASSTVRYWHAEYLAGEGNLRPDERGHHTRELLILEEDMQTKFVQWSLKMAKKDELSVDAARDYLNNELLNTLEACPSL